MAEKKYPPTVTNFKAYDEVVPFINELKKCKKMIRVKCWSDKEKAHQIVYTISVERSRGTGPDIVLIRQESVDVKTSTREAIVPSEFYKTPDEIFKWFYDRKTSDEFVDMQSV